MWKRLIRLLVPMAPKPKQSVRRAFRNGKAVWYTDHKMRRYEEALRAAVATMAAGFRPVPVDVPVRLDITFWMKRPKSRKRCERWHCTTPDLGNLVKMAEDAISGSRSTAPVLVENDKQICAGWREKRYTDGEPAIELHLYEWSDDDGEKDDALP